MAQKRKKVMQSTKECTRFVNWLVTIAVLASVWGLAPLNANAADGDIVTGWTEEGYQLKLQVISETEKTAKLYSYYVLGQGYQQCISKDISGIVTIPAETEGYRITTVGDAAFTGLTNLTEVVLPEGLEVIEGMAFANCYALERIVIPSTVREISTSMSFWFCRNLAWVSVREGNAYYDSRNDCNAVIKKDGNVLVLGSSNTIIPNDVEEIGTEAFCGRETLTSITIPASVKTIGYEAFRATSLTNIDLPDAVKRIDHYAFWECKKLTEMKMGSQVENIGMSAFSGCYALESINLSQNVTMIDKEAFKNCSALTEIILPSKLETIRDDAFSGCSELKEIVLPANVDSVGARSFSGCSGLKKIVLGKNITRIEEDAFRNCSSVTSVVSYMKVPISIGKSTFGSDVYKNAALSVPRGSRSEYASTSPWNEFLRITEFDPTANISIATMAEGLGTMAIAGVYEIGNDITLSASSEDGWIFDGWQINGALVSTNNEYIFTIIGDLSVVALFTRDPSGINNARNNNAEPSAYYSLDGKKMECPKVGVNIIRMTDGTTRKVVVR